MKLDKICRTCLVEKTCLKSIFSACLPNMLMTCSSIQVSTKYKQFKYQQ